MTLRRIKLTKLNEHLVCALCLGYYVEATTITECLHTFCRACIVNYLLKNSFCPVCEVQVHKTKPISGLRDDKTLQDIVYKLVPNLFRNEMRRRTKFYYEHPEAGGDRIEQSLKERRHFFHVDDQISLSLEFLPPAHAHAHALGLRPLRAPSFGLSHPPSETEIELEGQENDSPKRKNEDDQYRVPLRRYLKCPAAVQIRLLEKFIRLKYGLTSHHRVDIVHAGDCLSPELTLLDVVYMYKWTEDEALKLQYTVIAPPLPMRKRPRPTTSKSKLDCSSLKKPKLEAISASSNAIISKSSTPVSVESEVNPEDRDKSAQPSSLEAPEKSGGSLPELPTPTDSEVGKEEKESTNGGTSSLDSSRDDADDAMVIDESVGDTSSGHMSDKDSRPPSSFSTSAEKAPPESTSSPKEHLESAKPFLTDLSTTCSGVNGVKDTAKYVDKNSSLSQSISSKVPQNAVSPYTIKTNIATDGPAVAPTQSSDVLTPSVSGVCTNVDIPKSVYSTTKSSSGLSDVKTTSDSLEVGRKPSVLVTLPATTITPNSLPLNYHHSFTTTQSQTLVSTTLFNSTSVCSSASEEANLNSVLPKGATSTSSTPKGGILEPSKSVTPTTTALTPSLKTPLFSLRPKVPISSSVSPAIVTMVQKSTGAVIPRNLISNSYRASLQMNNNGVPRVNGAIPPRRPVFDPTKPRLGRPPKSVRLGVAGVGRVGPTNILPRTVVPTDAFNAKPSGSFDNHVRSNVLADASPIVPQNLALLQSTKTISSHVPLPAATTATSTTTPSAESKVDSRSALQALIKQKQLNKSSPASKNNANCKPSSNSKVLQNGFSPSAIGNEILKAKQQNLLNTIVNQTTLKLPNSGPSKVPQSPARQISKPVPIAPNSNVKSGTTSKSLKSPSGRGKCNSGNQPKILDIAETLVNKQLQQISQAASSNNYSPMVPPVVPSTSSTLAPSPALSQILNSSALGLPVVPSALQAACMAVDYAAVHNFLSLRQAALAHGMNMALGNISEADKTADSSPMDLSPTNKGAPSTTIASAVTSRQVNISSNIGLQRKSASPKLDPKSTASPKPAGNSPRTTSSPSLASSKSSQSSSSSSPAAATSTAAKSTIAPPTPEVTITKLPNTTSDGLSTSTSTNTTTVTKTAHANTISITKRLPSATNSSSSSSSSRFTSITRSPSNASIRQIPNPSLLSQQSEARYHLPSSSVPSSTVPSTSSLSIPSPVASSSTKDSTTTCTKSPQQPILPKPFVNNNNCNNANLNNTVKVDS